MGGDHRALQGEGFHDHNRQSFGKTGEHQGPGLLELLAHLLVGPPAGNDDTTGKTVTIEQIASANRRPTDQEQTLIGLRLNKLRRRSTLEDTPAVRGMISKVSHLVRIVDVKA